MGRFFCVFCVYLDKDIVVIEDDINNVNWYPTKYLNCLSLLRFLLYNLELKVRCLILLLHDIPLN